MTEEDVQVPVERSIGTLLLAREFADAASHVEPQVAPNMVLYFLAGHALELAFKAVLIASGTTERDLRALGHDLHACLEEIAARVPSIQLSEPIPALVNQMSWYYKAKAFEYVEPGFVSLPDPNALVQATSTMVTQLKRWVDTSVRQSLDDRRASAENASSREGRAKEIQGSIAGILRLEWDPIGVKDVPEAADEYDSYVGSIYRLLASGADEREIAQHLSALEKDMGVKPASADSLMPVAHRLTALNVKL